VRHGIAERGRALRQRDGARDDERDAERAVDPVARRRAHGVDGGAVREQRRERPEAERAQRRRPLRGAAGRERVQVPRVDERTRHRAVRGAQRDDARAGRPVVDAVGEPAGDGAERPAEPGDGARRQPGLAAGRVPDAGGDDDDAGDDARHAPDEVAHFEDTAGVHEHGAQRPHQPADGGVTDGPAGVEQGVLAERTHRRPAPVVVVAVADSVGVHRDQRPTHPEAVRAAEQSHDEEHDHTGVGRAR
jgi:hypothetical protein